MNDTKTKKKIGYRFSSIRKNLNWSLDKNVLQQSLRRNILDTESRKYDTNINFFKIILFFYFVAPTVIILQNLSIFDVETVGYIKRENLQKKKNHSFLHYLCQGLFLE